MRPLSTVLDRFAVPSFDLLLRLYLGIVFLCAAWGKIINPYDFAIAIATYQMMPTVVINPMAIVLPWFELFAAVLIILGIRTRCQVIAINGMLVVFMIAIGYAVTQGIEMTSCGCFASEEAAEQINWGYVIRDAVWCLMGVFVFFVREDQRWGIDNLIRHVKSKN